MAVSKGSIEYKNQKTFVKAFHVNAEDMEKEINDWIKSNEETCEIVDIKLLNDCQSKAIVLVICRHIDACKSI